MGGIASPIKSSVFKPVYSPISRCQRNNLPASIRAKLLLTLRPLVAGGDEYMIPESRQAELFAIFGSGLWFDSGGVAAVVDSATIAASSEINQWAVWYHTGEVLFYNPDTLLYSEYIKISNYFHNTSGLYDAILYYDAEEDPDTELTGGPSTFNSSILGPQYRRNADGTYTAVPAGGPIVDTLEDGFVGLRSCGAVTNLAVATLTKDPSATLTNGWYDFSACADEVDAVLAYSTGSLATDASKPFTGFFICEFLPEDVGKKIKYLIKRNYGTYAATTSEHTIVSGLNTLAPLTFTQAADGYGAKIVINKENDSGYATIIKPIGWMITQSSYPTPYVPPGVTQPASNATATGGNWFKNSLDSDLWQALDGNPYEALPQTPIWELAPTGASERIVATGNTITSISSLSNDVARIINPVGAFSQNDRIRVKYRLTSYSSGTFRILIYGTGYVGVCPNKSSNGTFEEDIVLSTVASAYSQSINIQALVGGSATIEILSVKRIQPQPLTMATRIKMGAGSGDVVGTTNLFTCNGLSVTAINYYNSDNIIRSYDGTTAVGINSAWLRNVIIRRFIQVNTASTQFRVGYMIEGKHSTIQWSSWVVYDGSFNPSTIYRFIFGYLSEYPMWLNKLAVWKRQVSDAELLEVFS